jgi:hypothetical protein
MSYYGDPGLPAGCTQDSLDRAINGDPERADPPKPLDVLDMITEARMGLWQAFNAMPDERAEYLDNVVEWATLARDTALATLGRADGEECKF